MTRAKSEAELVVRGAQALGLTNVDMAKELGCSRRTMQRWMGGQSSVGSASLAQLAHLVVVRDRALAEEILTRANAALVAAGLAPSPWFDPPPAPEIALPPPAPPSPAPPPPPRPPEITNAVVCAAAEAMDLSPRALRPAIVAAFRCARALGLSVAEVEEGLSAL